MKVVHLTFPELALVIGTRAMLGAGIALLAADKFEDKPRRALVARGYRCAVDSAAAVGSDWQKQRVIDKQKKEKLTETLGFREAPHFRVRHANSKAVE